LILCAAVLGALIANELLFRALRRAGRWLGRDAAEAISRRCWWPGRAVASSIGVELGLPALQLSPSLVDSGLHLVDLLLIGSVGWLIVEFVLAIEEVAKQRFRVDVPDNLQSRRVHTRVTVIRRVVVALVSVLVFGLMLTTFGTARSLGASILASAGIAGIVVGIAARPTITNLVAGLQIFFTEPIRIDDVVVVDGQWGRVEDITLVYVAVRLWDERRLILPIVQFVERPFENWTRHSANLLVTVFVEVDFTVPVQAVRDELWDRRFWNLQVTDLNHDAVQLRVLMTARDAGSAWDLRCEVREKLLEYLQMRHPQSLPRKRVQLAGGPDAVESAAADKSPTVQVTR
jgi:small-conductance mechanosensitive channel